MKTSEKIKFILFLVTGGLIFAGNYYNLEWLTRLSVIAVGCIGCKGGIRILKTGEAVAGNPGDSNPRYSQRYTGIPAQLVGVIVLLGSLTIIGFGLIDLFNREGAVTFLSEGVSTRYGHVILIELSGILITAFGIVRILTGSAVLPSGTKPHGILSTKIVGVIITIVGLVMVVSAIGSIITPEYINELFDSVVHFAKN